MGANFPALQVLQGNAEVERARLAAKQAELLASEAKKGESDEQQKARVVLANLFGVSPLRRQAGDLCSLNKVAML